MITDFQVMEQLSNQSKKLQMAPLNNIIEIKINKTHAEVRIGLPVEAGLSLSKGSLVGGLYLMDKDQFLETKKELESQSKKEGV